MGGRASREKGKRWEREVARMLREVMPGAEIKRGWQSRSGRDNPDVDCPVFWVEAKHHKLTNPREALRQAKRDAPRGRVPVAVCKDDRKPPFIVMLLDDWLDFIQEWWERGLR